MSWLRLWIESGKVFGQLLAFLVAQVAVKSDVNRAVEIGLPNYEYGVEKWRGFRFDGFGDGAGKFVRKEFV